MAGSTPPLGALIRGEGPSVSAQPGKIAESIAQCPPGYDVVSGGFLKDSPNADVFIDTWNTPSSWVAEAGNLAAPGERQSA